MPATAVVPAATAGLAAYLPTLVHDWARESPQLLWREVSGSLALVDVSGFTQLSEQLAARGRIGAEQLTDTIGDWCARLLEVAYSTGGSLLKFGGDALLLLFTGDGHTTRAARAAIGMGRVLERFGSLPTPAGPVTLRMSVGIHRGAFHFVLCGESHRELLVTGPGASETVRVEAGAAAGQILVSDAAAAVLPPECLGGGTTAGRLLVAEPGGPGSEPPPVAVRLPDEQLAAYVPAALREYLAADDHEAEHRRVSVAFIGFRGLDRRIVEDGPEVAATALDHFVRSVQRAADRHAVSFLATDIDHDGGKIILTSGAPVSAGNDEERMLLALREIVEARQPVPFHVGVNAGHVFAGDVGFRHRRSYTVMGDAVNLAARLMSRAGHCEVLATHAVLDASHTTFHVAALEPFAVKGKRGQVTAARVGPVSGTRPRAVEARLPLLGRAGELAEFERVLADARRGGGCLVEVVGEAGIGKTRLVEAFADEADGFDVHVMACELYRSSTPYAPLRRLLRALLGVAEDEAEGVVASRLDRVLRAGLPGALPWAPLLGIPLGVELPDTPETANLDEQFRRPRLHDVTVGLLRALLGSRPWLLVLEDAQWLDEASADLLRFLATQLGEHPWVVCLTRRGEDATFAGPAPSVALALRPLDELSTEALAVAATDDAPLPQHELAELVRRSGGNPLFLHELLVAGRAGGIDGLPDTVEALVTARIDQLPHDARSLLRHVSVLGRTFTRDLVDAVAPGAAIDDEATWRALAGFLARDGEVVAFRHVLIRDAAYEGLPFRLRRSLHATTGDVIAASGGDQDDLLSFHYFQAGRYREAWRYSLGAARAAAAIYANEEAARFYDRALRAAAELRDLAAPEVGGVFEALGDTLQRMGDYARAADAYQAARRRVGGAAVPGARLLLKQARVQARLRRYSQALGLVTRGLRRLDGIGGTEAGTQRAELMVWYGHLRQEQGKHAEAIAWSHRAIAEAERAGDRGVLAHAYRLLDWVYADRGQFDEATHSERALALYEELGDVASQAGVLNNMGGIAYWQGRWGDALRLYERASELDERTGDVVGAAFGRNNIGEILLDQGKVAQAERLFREAERVFRAAGYRSGIAFVRANLGRAAARDGRRDEALALLGESQAQWEEIGAGIQVQEAQARIAEAHVLHGDAGAALALAGDALGRAGAREGVAAQSPLLHRVRGYALMQLGDLEAAGAALGESLAAAVAREADYEVALTQRALVELAAAAGAPAPGDLLAASTEVLDRLGVEQLPAVPLPVGERR